MRKQWVINPDVGFSKVLAEFGRFLEEDYKTAIGALMVPHAFEEYKEKTGRHFVIIGARSVPTATAKSVFLCLKLAGPESVTVKAPTVDEGFLIDNVIEHYGKDVECKVFNDPSAELELSSEWRKALDRATDIVVFGGGDTVARFKELENEHRQVHVHGPKFSFGIIRAEQLTPSYMEEIGYDFFSFYGEGCLSPKFYVVVGEVAPKMWQEMSGVYSMLYGKYVDEFRAKLPLSRKSELVQQFLNCNYVSKYIRREKLNSDEIFSTLYGDVRFVVVEDLDDLQDFVSKWHPQISTVAIDEDDEDVVDFVEINMITRICPVGSMQFPDFFEPFDTTDDFDIYTGGY
jgi:hypothetical protein